jgi:acyl-CoA synthetase (NDP forming)
MRGFARIIADFAKDHEGRFIVYTTSALGPVDRELVDLLHAARIPLLLGTQRSMKAISLLLTYAECHERPSIVTGRADAIVPKRHASGVLPFLHSKELLQSFGDMCFSETGLAKTSVEGKAAARWFVYLVAVKLESTRLVHKSDAGCVILGCRNAAEVSEAFTGIEANAAKAGVADIDGVLVQPMADKLVEGVAGITPDPILGPAVVFGRGGIFIETINDTVTEIPPIDDRLAIEMIHRLRGKSVLFGGRGTELADADALQRFWSHSAISPPTDTLVSADLNPLMVGRKGQGAVAVDALLEMRDSETVSG